MLRDTLEEKAEYARMITDLRMPKEPFGLAAGATRTGHVEGDVHPAWCSVDECVVRDRNFSYHLSTWLVLYPGHAGEVAVFARLFSHGEDPVDEVTPGVELMFMRPAQASSLEGYEFSTAQAGELAHLLELLASAAEAAAMRRQVTS